MRLSVDYNSLCIKTYYKADGCRRTHLLISLYKNKVSEEDCRNYRGTSLFSVASQIFARILSTLFQKKASRTCKWFLTWTQQCEHI